MDSFGNDAQLASCSNQVESKARALIKDETRSTSRRILGVDRVSRARTGRSDSLELTESLHLRDSERIEECKTASGSCFRVQQIERIVLIIV